MTKTKKEPMGRNMLPHIMRTIACAIDGISSTDSEKMDNQASLAAAMMKEVLFYVHPDMRPGFLIEFCAKVKAGAEEIEKEFGSIHNGGMQ